MTVELAGNLTVVGSVANLIVLELAGRRARRLLPLSPLWWRPPHPLADFREQRRLLWCVALPVALVSVLLTVHLVLPFGRPSATVRRALEALASGDAARLRSEERLGFQGRAEREIEAPRRGRVRARAGHLR